MIADILRRLYRGEALQGFEARMVCQDGTIEHVLIDSNVLWEQGQFIYTRCCTHDITESKQADETRARQHPPERQAVALHTVLQGAMELLSYGLQVG